MNSYFVLGTWYKEEVYAHKKIAADPLFNPLISHFDKLIKASVDRYGKSE